jgi:Fe-Mn family superoxide dismutase
MQNPRESEGLETRRQDREGAAERPDEPRSFDPQTLELPALPYGYEALEPHISARTMEFHHDKHHRAYVDKTTRLIEGTPLEGKDLPEIIAAAREKKDRKLLSQAGQAWNHNIFWLSLSPDGGGAPKGRLMAMIDKDFGGLDGFKAAFREEATGHFGSGWAWLYLRDGALKVGSHHDGDTPVGREEITPLICCDLWEHAYYLDYQNRRADFIDAFLDHLINWDFAEANLPSNGS